MSLPFVARLLGGGAIMGWLLLAVTVTRGDEAPAASTPIPAVAICQQGTASWHAGSHRTCSGERWRAGEFMAAHRSLPLGSTVRVTNLRNGRATVVRITDRGPFTHGRIIDLSPAAAREIGLLEMGIAKVTVQVVPTEPGTAAAPAKPSA